MERLEKHPEGTMAFDAFPQRAETYEGFTFPDVPDALVPFIPHIEGVEFEQVSFHARPSGVTADVLKAAVSSCQRPSTRTYCGGKKFINKMCKRLANEVKTTRPKNEDRRLSFQRGNLFLVKSFFTFGLRQVVPGEIHFIETGPYSRILYLTPPSYLHSIDLVSRRMHRGQLHHFQQRMLQPGRTYRIPPGQWYLVATFEKSAMAVNVVPDEVDPLIQGHVLLSDPLLEPVLRGATPAPPTAPPCETTAAPPCETALPCEPAPPCETASPCEPAPPCETAPPCEAPSSCEAPPLCETTAPCATPPCEEPTSSGSHPLPTLDFSDIFTWWEEDAHPSDEQSPGTSFMQNEAEQQTVINLVTAQQKLLETILKNQNYLLQFFTSHEEPAVKKRRHF